MEAILAIETATDACSVALFRDGRYLECHEVAPRQHNQRLFAMLGELLPHGDLGSQGIEAIAYGCGPGSFTGLRIAASAVQGLAFAAGLRAVPVSTLACQAQTATRRARWGEGAFVLSTLDARINEAYCALYRVTADGLLEVEPPRAVVPGRFSFDAPDGPLHVVGSGLRLEGLFPGSIRECFESEDGAVVPHARDLVPLAQAKIRLGDTQDAFQVQPLYVKEEISWRKLSQQGKRK